MHSMDKVLITLSFVCGLAGAAWSDEVPQRSDQTLSPFFFVQSDDPSVDQLPLKSVRAEVHITGVIADVKIEQVFHNQGESALEATYVFPASTRAAVYGMQMTIGQRRVVAEIRERDQAREEYEQAREEGRSASLLEQQRPNVFQMSVVNILPDDTIVVELSYTELLVPTGGVYEFVYPTVVGPRYSDQPLSDAKPEDLFVATPYTREGEPPLYTFDIQVNLAAGMPIREVQSTSHQVDITLDGSDQARIALEQGEGDGGNRDYILQYQLAGDQIQSGLLLYRGEEENFFLLMAQPPERVTPDQIPPREYIFIVDVSGSMHGFPLNISKQLLQDLIGSLRPDDYFNVLLFAAGSAALAETSLPASEENIILALQVIDDQQGGGGTQLLPALRRALDLPRPDAAIARTVVIATDGYVSVEVEAFDLIRSRLGEADMFAFGIGSSVNRYIIEGMARAGMGESFTVTQQQEAEAMAARFRTYIESPVLTQVELSIDGFDAYEVEPLSLPSVLAERPVVVFGKWRGESAGSMSVFGLTGEGPYATEVDVAAVEPSEGNAALRYLWARHQIALLEDYDSLSGTQAEAITQLGLRYNLLTAHTSFVAVDQIVRRDGSVELVLSEQPLPLPQGVADEAVGDAMSAVEEFMASSVQLPTGPVLTQNWPNPFNSSTAIRFALPVKGAVALTVYNLAGQLVATLVEDVREAGIYTVGWDGQDDQGFELASGVYLYRLRVGQQVETRKLLLLR